MSQEEYTELNALLDAVAVQDVHLGRVLSAIVAHLPGYSDAEQAIADKAKAEAEQAAKEQEATSAAPEPAPEAAPAQEAVPEAPVESEQANAS